MYRCCGHLYHPSGSDHSDCHRETGNQEEKKAGCISFLIPFAVSSQQRPFTQHGHVIPVGAVRTGLHISSNSRDIGYCIPQKICSVSLVIKKIKFKATVPYYITPTGMAIIQTTTTNNETKKQNRTYQALVRMWRNWNTCALLVGVILENSSPSKS